MLALDSLLPMALLAGEPAQERRQHHRLLVAPVHLAGRGNLRHCRAADRSANRRRADVGFDLSAALGHPHHLSQLGRARGPPLQSHARSQRALLPLEKTGAGVWLAGHAGLGRFLVRACRRHQSAAVKLDRRPGRLRSCFRRCFRSRGRLAIGPFQSQPCPSGASHGPWSMAYFSPPQLLW